MVSIALVTFHELRTKNKGIIKVDEAINDEHTSTTTTTAKTIRNEIKGRY